MFVLIGVSFYLKPLQSLPLSITFSRSHDCPCKACHENLRLTKRERERGGEREREREREREMEFEPPRSPLILLLHSSSSPSLRCIPSFRETNFLLAPFPFPSSSSLSSSSHPPSSSPSPASKPCPCSQIPSNHICGFYDAASQSGAWLSLMQPGFVYSYYYNIFLSS